MNMNLRSILPRKIQNKAVSKYELDRYFQTNSIEQLVDILQQGERAGLFSFDVTISAEYLDWREARRKLLYPPELGIDLGFAQPVPYGLYELSSKIKNAKPLNRMELKRVVTNIPHNTLEQYLRFRLYGIDYKKLHNEVNSKIHHTDKDEDYDKLEYNGLMAMGAEITYLNEPIYMSFQHRQVVRLLLSKNGKLCTKDEFTENVDIFTGDDYHDINATLRKLISAVRLELKTVIKNDCIKAIPEEGWYLALDP
ncbi:hypothetical protein KC968_04305 [Candidatus Saccharibacteria bacterium]|nr:hypothetical protein [Candidatus Saccharibacteria bacterium]